MLRKITLSQAKNYPQLNQKLLQKSFRGSRKKEHKMNEASLKSKLKNLSKETGKPVMSYLNSLSLSDF